MRNLVHTELRNVRFNYQLKLTLLSKIIFVFLDLITKVLTVKQIFKNVLQSQIRNSMSDHPDIKLEIKPSSTS